MEEIANENTEVSVLNSVKVPEVQHSDLANLNTSVNQVLQMYLCFSALLFNP